MLAKARAVLLCVAAVFFTIAGLMHFRDPTTYLKIMPPYIPWHLAMVNVSGAAEIAGGIGLLIPFTRRAAGWGLTLLLIAVFPANVYMAMEQIQPMSFSIPPALLWLRLPLQAVLIWWVLWVSRAGARDRYLKT